MTVLPIREYPDPVLKAKAKPVTEINDEIQKLIDDMFETMYAAPGLGLAAPQIGRSLRLFVYDLQEGEEQPRRSGVLINPEFIIKSGSQTGEEGCLSVSDYRTQVTRADRAAVKGTDRNGKEVTVEGEGLMARLLQHEMDHLEGTLFVDRLSSLKRQMYLKRMKKRMKAEAK
jgi:peptide deformylase